MNKKRQSLYAPGANTRHEWECINKPYSEAFAELNILNLRGLEVPHTELMSESTKDKISGGFKITKTNELVKRHDHIKDELPESRVEKESLVKDAEKIKEIETGAKKEDIDIVKLAEIGGFFDKKEEKEKSNIAGTKFGAKACKTTISLEKKKEPEENNWIYM